MIVLECDPVLLARYFVERKDWHTHLKILEGRRFLRPDAVGVAYENVDVEFAEILHFLTVRCSERLAILLALGFS